VNRVFRDVDVQDAEEQLLDQEDAADAGARW